MATGLADLNFGDPNPQPAENAFVEPKEKTKLEAV